LNYRRLRAGTAGHRDLRSCAQVWHLRLLLLEFINTAIYLSLVS